MPLHSSSRIHESNIGLPFEETYHVERVLSAQLALASCLEQAVILFRQGLQDMIHLPLGDGLFQDFYYTAGVEGRSRFLHAFPLCHTINEALHAEVTCGSFGSFDVLTDFCWQLRGQMVGFFLREALGERLEYRAGGAFGGTAGIKMGSSCYLADEFIMLHSSPLPRFSLQL